MALGVGFQGAFCYVMSRALPYNAWAWNLAAFSPFSLTSSVRNAARRNGEHLLAQAKEGVLAGLDEDDDDQIDQVCAGLAPWGSCAPRPSDDDRSVTSCAALRARGRRRGGDGEVGGERAATR